jgi:gliding motility-associated-like protein
MYTDRLGEPNEKTFVKINNQDAGFMTGMDQNSINFGAGVMGHFYYQNQTLFGLSDDTPDNLYGPNEGDGLADIANYLPPFSTAFNFELKHSGYPNQNPGATNINLAYFLAYTSPCDTFTATLTGDTSVCAGVALPLNATGGGNTVNQAPYEWSPQIGLSCYNCPNPVFSFPHDPVINYSVRIRNNDSCSKVLPLRIWVKPKPHITNVTITKPACGSANGQIQITGLSGAQPPYEYTLNGQTQTTGLFTGLAAGNYTLTITGTNGCAFDTLITLPDTLLVNALFTANPQEGTAPLTVQFTNQSSNATDYVWLINGETFTTENITYTFNQSGNYTATLIAYNNIPACADTFSVDIFVYDDLSVIVPNIFSPNADGVNDVFGINVNVGCAVQCVIYNRWGAEVKNITKEISGAGFMELWQPEKNITDGVYFYVIKAKPEFGEEQVIKGNITLVR